MKKLITAVCHGDPFTQSELKQLRQLQKEKQAIIYVALKKDGILPYELRYRLTEKALAPFRKLKMIRHVEIGSVVIELDEKDEVLIRQGKFYLSAQGIRRELLQHGYYFWNIVCYMCNPKRAAHAYAVAQVCVDLARKHRLNETLAWQMGILHDITKNQNEEWSRRCMLRYNPEAMGLHIHIWHSYTALIWLKQSMGLCNYQILNAIRCHTIGNGKSNYAKILYIADKIEPTRGYDTTKQLYLAYKNLDEARDFVLQEAKMYILKKEGIHV